MSAPRETMPCKRMAVFTLQSKQAHLHLLPAPLHGKQWWDRIDWQLRCHRYAHTGAQEDATEFSEPEALKLLYLRFGIFNVATDYSKQVCPRGCSLRGLAAPPSFPCFFSVSVLESLTLGLK